MRRCSFVLASVALFVAGCSASSSSPSTPNPTLSAKPATQADPCRPASKGAPLPTPPSGGACDVAPGKDDVVIGDPTAAAQATKDACALANSNGGAGAGGAGDFTNVPGANGAEGE